MFKLKLRHHFDAAHNLLNYQGQCSNLHGHRWNVEVTIIGKNLKNDMIVDFKEIKAAIDKYDHAYLNESFDFNPTAENIVKKLYDEIKELTGMETRVVLFEAPDSSIEYYEE